MAALWSEFQGGFVILTRSKDKIVHEKKKRDNIS